MPVAPARWRFRPLRHSRLPWLPRLLPLFPFLLLFTLPWPAAAEQVLPVPALTGRVLDQTGTLTASQTQALTDRLAAIEAGRGAQIVVLMVPTTQPEDIATYSQRIADSWKIGRAGIGDGVVIVVAKTDRRVDIQVAKSLEGAIPDVLAGRIINDPMKTAFRADDYAGGLTAAIDRLDRAIAGEGLPAPTVGGRGATPAPRASAGFDLQDLAIFLFVGAPVIGGVLTGIFGRKFGALLTGGAVGAIGWWLSASLLVAAGAGLIALVLVGIVGMGSSLGGRGGRAFGGPVIWGGGGGGFGGRGGGGGGGFGSGGGGNFGGGGASGSW